MSALFRFLKPFKLFIPSWNFFDRIEVLPALFYRTSSENTWTDWQRFQIETTRTPLHLILNPQENYFLYIQSQVERLLVEASEQKSDREVIALECYQRILELIIDTAGPQDLFQFKIVDLGNQNSSLLVSHEHETPKSTEVSK